MAMIEVGGKLYGTGLQTPLLKKTNCKKFKTGVGPEWVKTIISSKDRVAGRDLFDKTWVKNQGQIGSCNGYAATTALEKSEFTMGRERTVLAGEFTYMTICGGRDVGSMLDDGAESLMTVGAAPFRQDMYQQYRENKFRAEDYRDAKNHKAFEVMAVETELDLASGLARGYQAVVAVHAGNRFMDADKDGIAGYHRGSGNHAVQVDDVIWKNGRFLFDMQNSWGTSYCDDGRAYLTWDHLRETSKYHWFYLIRAASPDQEGPILN